MGVNIRGISLNREPRLSIVQNGKNSIKILVHDNAGIYLPGTKLYMGSTGRGGDQQNIQLIESSNGVYTNTGTIAPSEYTGKKYDYGFVIKRSQLTTTYINFFLEAVDGLRTCYITENFRLKNLAKQNTLGEYFLVDRAPRITIGVSDGQLYLNAVDQSGVKDIKLLTVGSNSTPVINFSGKLSSGEYIKSGNTALFGINRLNRTKLSDGKHFIRIVSEDCSGNRSDKTMIINVK